MSLAKSYANALLGAAIEKKLSAADLDQVEASIGELAAMLASSKELRAALLSPRTTAKEKTDVIAAIAQKMGAPTLVAQFFSLIAKKERFDHLSEISEELSRARIEAAGGVLGHVVSADPVEAADLLELAAAFTQRLGRKATFRASTDPELLAGLKISVGGVTFDGTLRSQLQRLRDRLVAGATGTSH